MILESGATFVCPWEHCREPQEGVIDDYAIAGRVGLASESDTQCGYCDGWFTVSKLKDGSFFLTEQEDEDDDEDDN